MFTMSLRTLNDAFGYSGESRAAEVARILRVTADKLERGECGGPTMDLNGNSTGHWQIRGPVDRRKK